MTREQAYAAVFALLAPYSSTFNTISRRLALVETLDSALFPAIYQQQVSEPLSEKNYSIDQGVVWSILDIAWYIYGYQGDETLPTTPILNPLVDLIVNTVLAGLVTAPLNVGSENLTVRLTGITYWEGVLGDRAVCRLDLRVYPVNIP